MDIVLQKYPASVEFKDHISPVLPKLSWARSSCVRFVLGRKDRRLDDMMECIT